MAQAAYCSQCGTNVYVTEDGRCPQGHGPESLSNYYEVGDGGATTDQSAAQPGYSPVEQPAYSPTEQPAYSPAQQAYSGAGQPMAPAPKKNKTLTIVLIIVAVLVLCAVGTSVAMCTVFKGAVDVIEEGVDSGAITVDTDTSTSTGSQGPDTTPALESGVARVTLGWDGPADLDLEVWSADGDDYLTDSMSEFEDVTDGTQGREYFDFKDDYGSGTYVISVYFLSENGGSDSAMATLTVFRTDGTTETRTGEVFWDPDSDQWHAFSIDASTGEIVEEINRFVD